MENETKEILQLVLSKVSSIDDKVSSLDSKVSSLDDKVSSLELGQQKLSQDIHDINLKLENVVEPKIQLIYENQVAIIDNNKKMIAQDGRIEALETDVFALKYAFMSALKQNE